MTHAPTFGVDAAKLAELVAAELREGEPASRSLFDTLRGWRQRLDTILRVVTDGVVVLDFTGCVAYANAPACRLLGVEVPAILGGDLDALFAMRRVTDASSAPVELPGRAAFAGEERGEQLVRLAGDGTTHWTSIRVAPMWDEARRVLAVLLVLRDVTEARRAEERLRLLADVGGLHGETLDPDDIARGMCELVVARFAPVAAIFASGVSHVAERGVGLADALSAWWAEHGASALGALHEPALVAPGDPRWPPCAGALSSAIAAPLSARGRVLGTLLLFSDDATFDALDLDAARDLAQRAALALDNALLFSRSEEANRRLEDADRRKDELLAILAHELRNPLTPMLTSVELLRRNHHDRDALVAILERQTLHLAHLVDDLLEVSRIAHGRIELRREVLDLDQPLARVLEWTAPLLESRQQTIELERAPEPVLVDADPLRLEQVFGNLLQNAIRYSARGGHIVVRVRAADDRAEAIVEDAGIGIEPELLPRVFDLFGQNHGDRRHGLGVGLHVARALVELHGGVIRAESEGSGRGSRFIVSLPRAAHSERVSTPEPPIGAPVVRDALVVDDDRDVANVIAMMLERLGCEARIANDGASALAMAEARAPELVLLDLGMPGMSGTELARALRASGSTARIVALSGYASASDRQRSREAGCELHLAKPVPMRVLAALVAGVEVEE